MSGFINWAARVTDCEPVANEPEVRREEEWDKGRAGVLSEGGDDWKVRIKLEVVLFD